jgi:hypothetical protein
MIARLLTIRFARGDQAIRLGALRAVSARRRRRASQIAILQLVNARRAGAYHLLRLSRTPGTSYWPNLTGQNLIVLPLTAKPTPPSAVPQQISCDPLPLIILITEISSIYIEGLLLERSKPIGPTGKEIQLFGFWREFCPMTAPLTPLMRLHPKGGLPASRRRAH